MKTHHWVWIVVFVWLFFGYLLTNNWITKGGSIPARFFLAVTWPYWVFLAGQAPPPSITTSAVTG